MHRIKKWDYFPTCFRGKKYYTPNKKWEYFPICFKGKAEPSYLKRRTLQEKGQNAFSKGRHSHVCLVFFFRCFGGFVFVVVVVVLFFFFFFFCLFRATPLAHGGSQARGQVRAVAAGLHLSHITTQDLSCVCNLHHSLWQCQILNPRGEARDQTCILMDASQVNFHWATMGTPSLLGSEWECFPQKTFFAY